jgi:hypothetical protein
MSTTTAPTKPTGQETTTKPTLIDSNASQKAPVNNTLAKPVPVPAVPAQVPTGKQSYITGDVPRGEGINYVSDRLNFGKAAPPKPQPPREVVEVIKEKIIWKDDPNQNTNARTEVVTKQVVDDSININARNILAEAMARSALLVMENNRLRYKERQVVQDINALRSRPVETVSRAVYQPPVETVSRAVYQPPVETTVYKPVEMVRQQVVDDSINTNARNILAESQARVALFIMENNRLRYYESQLISQIQKLSPGSKAVEEFHVPVYGGTSHNTAINHPYSHVHQQLPNNHIGSSERHVIHTEQSRFPIQPTVQQGAPVRRF